MFDPKELGKITPDEQADALRTLIAVFATSVVREGRDARNAISAEILDIVDDVPLEHADVVAQLFSVLTLRLRRRMEPRRTVFRQALETALLAHGPAGGGPVASEADYLGETRPDLAMIDDACSDLLARLPAGAGGNAASKAEASAWLSAQALAAALVNEDLVHGHAEGDHAGRDLAVGEFLLRTAAQYLVATANRRDGDG